MIKGMVLYKKLSGTKLLYSNTKDNIMYGIVQEVSGKTYPEKSVQSIISKGYWDAVYLTYDDMEKHQSHDQASHGSWAGTNQITSEQKKAVQAYAQKLGDVTQWRSVAQNIRDGKTPDAPPEFVSSVKTLLNAIDEHSVTPTNGNGKVLLRSGINWKGKLPAVGDVMSNPISSATWRHNVAEKFASSGDGKSVIIKYGSSTKGLDVSKFGADLFDGEGEFIVSGKFEVVDRLKENGFTYVSLRAVDNVTKHQDHDQSTHGSWASGGNLDTKKGLQVQAKQFNNFEDFSRAVSLQGMRPRAWHITDEENFNPSKDVVPMSRTGESSQESILFVGDPASWRDYASGRKVAVEYDLTNLKWEKDYATDKSGNQGFYIKPDAYSKLKKIGEFSVDEAVSRASEQQKQMPKSKTEALSIYQNIEKHQDHDQRSHGSWAHGGGDNAVNNFEKKVNEAYGTGEEAFSIYNTGDESVGALGEYLGRGHILNGNIRSSGDDDRGDGKTYNEGSVVKGIDNAIELAPRIPNQTVYRIASKEVIESLTKNSIYTDKGFTSTTAVDITAPGNGKLLMTLNFVSPGKKTIMKIDTGSVGKGLYMPKMFPGQPIAEFEREFLMPRNTKMKYLGPDYMFTPNDQILTIHKFKVVE